MFYGLLQEVLNESVAPKSKILRALNNHEKVIITYKPVTPGREHATGPRLAGVFAYGITSAGNDCIRIYEYAGDTATFVPGWKLLRIDQILTWKNTGQIFTDPPDEKFNPDGDKTMAAVYKVAKFGDDVETNDNEKGPKTAQDLFKTDAEKEIEKRGKRIKSQFDNPVYISDLKAKKGLEDYIGSDEEFTDGPKTADNVNTNEPATPSYKDEVDKMFAPLRDKIKNAPKIDLNPKPKETPATEPEETNEPSYKDEVSKMFAPLRDKIKNAPKIDLNPKPRTTEPQPEEPKQPAYKDEVSKQFQPLRDKIKNAPKINLSQYEKEKELRNLRKKLGDTSKPIKLRELKERLGFRD